VKATYKSLFGNDSQSLGLQISRTTDRLDEHRRTAGVLSASLRSRLRSALVSPGGLWIAGCAGFVAAEWIYRPARGLRPASQQVSSSPRRPPATALANVVLLLKFAEGLRIIWMKTGLGMTEDVRQRTEERGRRRML
jgi:hypothetical protein